MYTDNKSRVRYRIISVRIHRTIKYHHKSTPPIQYNGDMDLIFFFFNSMKYLFRIISRHSLDGLIE